MSVSRPYNDLSVISDSHIDDDDASESGLDVTASKVASVSASIITSRPAMDNEAVSQLPQTVTLAVGGGDVEMQEESKVAPSQIKLPGAGVLLPMNAP